MVLMKFLRHGVIACHLVPENHIRRYNKWKGLTGFARGSMIEFFQTSVKSYDPSLAQRNNKITKQNQRVVTGIMEVNRLGNISEY